MPEPGTLKIEQREHPFGEQGVRLSLEEVARRVAEGALHPKVRAWAISCLERARREQGIACGTERERAEVLLRAVQRKLWVPDPTGSEWIEGAHLLACDASTKDQVCFHGSDCDGLVVLLGACFMSVGLYVLVVGHAHDAAQTIGHVLTAVRVDGKWHYAEPSADFPLGKCVRFTRERVLSVPNVKVLCDGVVCIRTPDQWNPDRHGFVEKGVFVGVDGPPRPVAHGPTFAWLAEPAAKMQWLGGWMSDGSRTAAIGYCATQGAGMLSAACGEIGGRIGGFIEQGVSALMASTDVGGPLDPFVQDAATRAVDGAFAELTELLNSTIAQLVAATGLRAPDVLKALVRNGLQFALFSETCNLPECKSGPTDWLACERWWWRDCQTAYGLSPPSVQTPGGIAVRKGAYRFVPRPRADSALLKWYGPVMGLDATIFEQGMGYYKAWAESLRQAALPILVQHVSSEPKKPPPKPPPAPSATTSTSVIPALVIAGTAVGILWATLKAV